MESVETSNQDIPFDRLVETAHKRLSELIPEFSTVSEEEKDKIAELFVGDVLEERNIRGSSSFHRFPPQRQSELLKEGGMEKPELLFEGNISEHLVSFFRKRIIDGSRPAFDPLTDLSVREA